MGMAVRSGLQVVIVAAALACSGSEEPAEAPAVDPAALRASCTAEVTQRCAELQRAEQVDCVRREVESCIRAGGEGG